MKQYIPFLAFDEKKTIRNFFLSDDVKRPNRAVRLVGPPGVGKTLLAVDLAEELGCPLTIINGVSSMIDLDLLGNFVLKNKSTEWANGPLPDIIEKTKAHPEKLGILLINEINALTENAQMALNPLLDHQAQVVLTQKNNEVIGLDDDCKLLIICTMNPDVRGINAVQDSVVDRIPMVIKVGYPNIDTEYTIIAKQCGVKEENIKKYVNLGVECRHAATNEHTVDFPVSPRGVIDWVNASKIMKPMLAFELFIANRYGTTDQQIRILNTLAKGAAVNKWSSL